jgi:adenylate cyclase, class 2
VQGGIGGNAPTDNARIVIETEIKLRFESGDAARQAIDTLGAAPHTPRRLQDDALLDDEAGTLYGRRSALRVRREGDRGFVTFKGPVIPGPMKSREEIETSIGDGDTMLRVFRELGYTPRFRYQKYREERRLGGLIVAIDETPIGVFVELEGPEAEIAAAAGRLGFTPAEYIRGSYRTLFLAYRERHGLTSDHMLFSS